MYDEWSLQDMATSSTASPQRKTNKTGCDRAVNTTFHLFFFSHSLLFLSLTHNATTFPPLSLGNITYTLLLLLLVVVVVIRTMSSILHSFQKNHSLPLSQNDDQKQYFLRRRLSSLSLKIQPISSQTTQWAFRRSKSVSSMGQYAGTSIRNWWDWGWSWILSRKPLFAKDLEMNDEETVVLGSHSKGSWRHVFYKVKSEIRKLVGSDKVGLPQTCKYSSFDYSKNFEG